MHRIQLLYKWQVSTIKFLQVVYEIQFLTPGNSEWQLYGPNEKISDVPSVEMEFADSSIQFENHFSNQDKNNPSKAKSLTTHLLMCTPVRQFSRQ